MQIKIVPTRIPGESRHHVLDESGHLLRNCVTAFEAESYVAGVEYGRRIQAQMDQALVNKARMVLAPEPIVPLKAKART